MAHLQYMPGDPRLVDQLVYELKSKGIFDQFRKDCIADVDTRPAYQNLRQRVESSVSSFLSRQSWKPDLNKNQLREKLRKHILDGNYLEQGVERIVDQVVNPKVASVFIPQVEDVVYNYLGISRKKSVTATETSNGKIGTDDLLPTDLEAVSPGSVKSNDDKNETMDQDFSEENKMDTEDIKDRKDEEKASVSEIEREKIEEGTQIHPIIELTNDSDMDLDKTMSMHDGIRLENIPPPDNSPPKIELENIELPKEPNISSEIPHPDEIPLPKVDKNHFFKPIDLNSEDDSSSDSSLRRNMSPLTPIRNYNNENSCDAQQAFENDSDSKSNENENKKEPSSFRFAIEAKSPENSLEGKPEKKDSEQVNLAYQFNNQVNINTFNTPLYDESSNSNNLQIDYESDVNSKTNIEKVPEVVDQYSEDKRDDKKNDDRKSSNKSSHRSRDSYRHSSSKDKRSHSKQSTSRDSSRHDKKSKDDRSKSKSSHREREKSRDRSGKKDSRDSSKHRSYSHKSSSSHRDSKSHRSSSSSQRHSSDKKSSDDKKSSSGHKDKSEKIPEKSSDRSSRDKRDSKSSSHRSDKDRKKSSTSKHDEKEKKKDKKETDDHYSLSGRGNHGRRSTDRDSNDGSSSSKGSQNQSATKPIENKKENKGSSSKSDNTSTSGESTSPSDKDHGVILASETKNSQKPIRVENHLEVPIASPPRLPFVPDVTLKKPKFAANLEEAKRMMKMRKFLDEEQKRMNQEAALLLEFQANVRPSLSQVYSSIPGPELEFACITNEVNNVVENKMSNTEQATEEKIPIEPKESVQENELDQIKKEVMKSENNDEFKTEVNNEATCELKNEEEDIPKDDIEKNEEDLKQSSEKNTYNENKPFSELMDEISEYSKASEKNKKDAVGNVIEDEDKKRTEYFEVTIITEELSETDDPPTETVPEIIVEPETETKKDPEPVILKKPENSEDESLVYFAEHEKFEAELKRQKYNSFLKSYTEKNLVSNKIHVINCDSYEENILKEVSATFGTYEIINYYKNGHLKRPRARSVVKNVNLASEISLPVDKSYRSKSPSPSVFSPVKSECSFELSSDYDAKLEEMVNKTSRQEVMEIILGNVVDDNNPTIDYCTESSIDNEMHSKRKLVEVESTENNNRQVLKKVRKLSDSDQISSTTEDSEEVSNNNRVSNPPRSKYLGRARRVGLSRPRRTNLRARVHRNSKDSSPAHIAAPPTLSRSVRRSHPKLPLGSRT